MIPICVPPYPDELWISYIRRLAILNGFERLYEFEALYLQPESYPVSYKGSYRNLILTCDRHKDMSTFPGVEQILKMDTFYIDIDNRDGYEQAKLSEAILFDYGLGNHKKQYRHKELRFCPECVKEDKETYGEAYLHVHHHFSNVKICHRHQVPLCEIEDLTYQKKRKKNAFIGEVYQEIEISDLETEKEKVKMYEEMYKKQGADVFKTITCSVCGNSYPLHSYSERT